MRKINIVFILVLLLTIIVPTSCKKNTIQYAFDGRITNSLTDNAVSAVGVTISQKIIVNGAASTGHSFAGSTTTDAAGNWALTIDREKVTEFLIEFEKESYFPIELLESSANVSTENINTYSPKLEPISWVTFDIENLWPNDDDHFKLVTQTFREDCEECAVNTTINFYGAVDTTFTYATTAGEYVKFTYINVNTASSSLDSVFTTPFETNVYEITY